MDYSGYYCLSRSNDNTIPLLQPAKGSPQYLYLDKKIQDPKELLFEIAPPFPPKPQLADYHSSPYHVVSKRIADSLNLSLGNGVQLLSAKILLKNGTEINDYFAIHSFLHIQALDLEKSNCTLDDTGLLFIGKLILNGEHLGQIPLEDRLIFTLSEDSGYNLFHESIVEQILSLEPSGMKFTRIEDWSYASMFS